MELSLLKEIFSHYDFNENQYIGIKPISVGHINTTYVLYFDYGNRVKRYLLQKINTTAFKNPQKLMQNIENVTTYAHDLLKSQGVKNYKHRFLRIYKTNDDHSFVKTKEGDYYRVYHYVEGCVSYNTSNNPAIFYNAGMAIGEFQNILSTYPSKKLNETIKDFHNTPKRYRTFLKTVIKCDNELLMKCSKEVQFFKKNSYIANSIYDLLKENKMPLRVTHNDTKISNIMFNYDTNDGQCLIDLDTIMPGSICYDFGDFVRSGCNLANEDEKNLTKVKFAKNLFISFAKGYIKSVLDTITEIELENLTMGAIVMTYECGMRFLTDYLDGNTYFHIDYEDHNLVRTRTQIKMVQLMLRHKDELNQDILNIYKNLKEENEE